MKHVFNQRELFHVFANQSDGQEYGRAGSVSFDGNLLYSYSLPIANIVDAKKKIALVTTDKRSVTTAKHISCAWSALSHYTQIEVYNVRIDGYNAATVHKSNIRDLTNKLDDIVSKQARAVKSNYTSEYTYLVHNLQAYVKLFKLKNKLTKKQRRYFDGAPLVIPGRVLNYNDPERVAARQKAQEYRDANRERLNAAKKARNIQKFRDRETNSVYEPGRRRYGYNYYIMPAYLRLNEDKTRIETSKGAQVLVSSARILWNTIKRVKESGQEYVPSETVAERIKIDYYTLNKVTADGNIIIGCHNILYSESELIAKELKWIE